MRIIIGLVIACLFCFIAIPVEASSFGLSPAVISLKAIQGGSSTFYFTVSSYSGLVEISAEGMPVTVSPSSVTAVAGTPISVIISCNSDANPGTYDGRIKFLAKSGGSVLAGINVICNLIVAGASANVSLTTTVVSGGGDGGGGGFDSGDSISYTPPNWAAMFPSMNQPQSSSPVDNRPVATNPPIYIPPVVATSTTPPTSTTSAVTPVPTTPAMDRAVWAGIAFWAIIIGLFVWGLSWLVDRKRKTVQ